MAEQRHIKYIVESPIALSQHSYVLQVMLQPGTLTDFEYEGWWGGEVNSALCTWAVVLVDAGEDVGTLVSPAVSAFPLYEPEQRVIAYGCIHTGIVTGPGYQRYEGASSGALRYKAGDKIVFTVFTAGQMGTGTIFSYNTLT